MDAVVYPDEKVREIARSFVCIRVDHDRDPDLVQRFGVQAIPDLRFLDAEARELRKLVGMISASRLRDEAQAVLDRLAGKEASPVRLPERAPHPEVTATPGAIEASVQRGLSYLQSAWHAGLPRGSPGFEAEGLVLLAWCACGGTQESEELARLCNAMLDMPLQSTYQAALESMALARLDPFRQRGRLEACARFLADAQLANGQWTYGPRAEGGPPQLGDNSNTAYALLGLAACRRAGVAAPRAAIERAEAWWKSSQNPDGGWGYRSDRESESYASMSESGMGSLVLCRRILGSENGDGPALARASAWLAQNFSLSENRGSSYQQGRLFYHLYALERLGTLLDARELAGHDWYGEGAAYLLSTQGPDGSWDDGADTPVANTCFALLFLTRATRAVIGP
jgi:hypothetical protein